MPIHRETKPSAGPNAGSEVRGKPRATPRAIPRGAAKSKGTPASAAQAAVRAAKVARAKRLIEDPNYPPPQVIQSVAQLLARNAKIAEDPSL